MLRLSLVCHGNIGRSQILHHYLRKALSERGIPVELFSCGTAPQEAYPNDRPLLAEVQKELNRRAVPAVVERTVWGPQAEKIIGTSDVVLVADEARRLEVLQRTDISPSNVYLFYEFIGEEKKDFVDTFDPEKGRQDGERFMKCFDELQRIAERAAERIRSCAER